jgi:hypothetical protein
VCYDFFFVASQIYVDKKAPRDQRGSAQGLIALVTLGLGMFFGTILSGELVKRYPPLQVPVTALVKDAKTGQNAMAKVDASLPVWPAPKADATPGAKGEDFASQNDANGDGKLSPEEMPGEWREKDKTYTGEALTKAFPKIDTNGDKQIERPEWRKASSNVWETIWLWPAGLALFTCLLFAVGFHDKVEEKAEPAAK